MTLQRFIFETTDGATVGDWTIRDIGDNIPCINDIIVLSGKRFEIIGHRAPTLARDKDAWARILIVWPHTP